MSSKKGTGIIRFGLVCLISARSFGPGVAARASLELRKIKIIRRRIRVRIRTRKPTSGEEDEVDSSVDTGHGNNVLLGGRECLPDPRKRVPRHARTALHRIHPPKEPVRVVHLLVTRFLRQPCE